MGGLAYPGSLEFIALLLGIVASAATIFGLGLKVGRAVSERNQASASAGLMSERDELRLERNSIQDQLEHYKEKYKEVEQLAGGETTFWLRKATYDLVDHSQQIEKSIPILTIANFKGGVGKTTLTANLAAYFEQTLNKRVLLIDFDYQGSLSDSTLPHGLEQLEFSANKLIDGTADAATILNHSQHLRPTFSKARLFPSFYTLNRVENRVLFSWLVTANSPDIRYNTHRVLSSKQVQEAFDIVLIDAPPRLMTATANALCASTHVLVPTILDNLCVNATVHTVGVVRDIRKNLCPNLQLLGLVPTMTTRSTLNEREKFALKRLEEETAEYWPWSPSPHVFADAFIPRREAIAKAAGYEIAFNTEAEVREMFSTLGEQIANKVFHADTRVPSGTGATGRSSIQLAG